MNEIVIAGPGDPSAQGSRMVFLLDERWYADEFFAAHFDKVTPGASVECADRDGRKSYRLDGAARRHLADLRDRPVHVLFFASSDTHVKTFVPLARLCDAFSFVVRYSDDHSAIDALKTEGLPWEVHSRRMEAWAKADVAITGNDWGLEERLFVARARRRALPTVCLQESIIDIGGPQPMMQCADYAMIQGPYTLRYLKRDCSFLVGNPRYDSIKPLPLPNKPKVFINCNFTFGIYEQAGRPWIEDVVTAARDIGLPYTISLHPRCYIDLGGIDHVEKSNVYVVHDQMRSSSIVVTRFSSLAHEALLMGRHVVYYNPHGEQMKYLNEDETGLLAKAYSREDLRKCMAPMLSSPPPIERVATAQAAFTNLFCSTDGRNHVRCVAALRAIAAHANRYPPSDYISASTLGLLGRVYFQTDLRHRLRKFPGVRLGWRVARRAWRNR